jgi:ABC-2 type transport system permease protein
MAVFARLIPDGSLDASATGLGFLFSDVNVISILGGVAAGLLVCGDLDNKTIHDAVANGYSRFTVLAGKAAVLSLMVVLLLLPYAVTTWIALGTGAECADERQQHDRRRGSQDAGCYTESAYRIRSTAEHLSASRLLD